MVAATAEHVTSNSKRHLSSALVIFFENRAGTLEQRNIGTNSFNFFQGVIKKEPRITAKLLLKNFTSMYYPPHYALCIMNYALVKAVHAPCNL